MPRTDSDRDQRSQLLDGLIAKYELAAELGHPFDPEDCLRQHPTFVDELCDYFAVASQLQGLIGPPRANLTATTEVGLRIRDYQILEKIGAGGMGTVYLARHTRLDKTVALKIMKGDRERDSQAIARFEREMWAVGKLEHPHIVRALDAGDQAGTHFLVMEFLEGCDLGRLLKAKGRMEVPLACELIRQAALGLQHAHDNSLVHRDVKPSNLLFSASGQVKVLDLGLAQLQAKVNDPLELTQGGHATLGGTPELTRAGQFVGTWRYMAPEQFMPSRPVDSRADIYSLGVTLYNFLVGELPLGPGQTASYLPPIATLRPDVPPDVQALLGRMLAFHPEERVQTMSQVASELQTYSQQGSASIRALGESWRLPNPGVSNALDGTQPWSSTANDLEIIQPPVPEPQQGSTGALRDGASGLSQLASSTGVFAVLAVVVLGLLILSNSVAKTWERKQAAARIAELEGITARALERGDLTSAEASVQELVAISSKFANLVDAQLVNGFQETIRARNRAAERRRAYQVALGGKQWESLPDKLNAYLQEKPYATEVDEAQSLLADVQFLLANLPSNQARVAEWNDAKLAEFLLTGKWPPMNTIANESVRKSFQKDLLKWANEESNGRRTAALAIELDRLQKVELDRLEKAREVQRKIDEARAAAILVGKKPKPPDTEKEEWLAHPERHGHLALIPQDAIGGISVANMNKLHEILDDLVRDFAGIGHFIAALSKPVLATRPIGCYQPDQPLALVFANPVKAIPDLKVDPFNPVLAMFTQATLESLGVVVGTPIALAKVEDQLELKGGLFGGRMQHATVNVNGVDKVISVLMRDKRLYVGYSDDAVNSVAESLSLGNSLAKELDAQEGIRLASMDALLHFGPGTWKESWGALATNMRTTMAVDKDDKEGAELADSFEALMRRAGKFVLGVKVKMGLEISLLVVLSPHDDARLDRFQFLLGEGDAPLTFRGLPQDGATVAFATRGNGSSNALIVQSLFLLPLGPGWEVPFDNRTKLATAFREVWNQVQGTRTAAYSFGDSVVVMLDTDAPEQFIARLTELVNVFDRVSIELMANTRFALTEEVFDGRKAYLLTITERAVDELKLMIVPVGKQMVLFYGKDQIQLSQAIKNVTAEVPHGGLAEHPGVVEAEKRLPPTRSLAIHLWVSELIRKFSPEAEKWVGAEGAAKYSSTSLTLRENSLGVDVWIPQEEIAWFLKQIMNRELPAR